MTDPKPNPKAVEAAKEIAGIESGKYPRGESLEQYAERWRQEAVAIIDKANEAHFADQHIKWADTVVRLTAQLAAAEKLADFVRSVEQIDADDGVHNMCPGCERRTNFHKPGPVHNDKCLLLAVLREWEATKGGGDDGK